MPKSYNCKSFYCSNCHRYCHVKTISFFFFTLLLYYLHKKWQIFVNGNIRNPLNTHLSGWLVIDILTFGFLIKVIFYVRCHFIFKSKCSSFCTLYFVISCWFTDRLDNFQISPPEPLQIYLMPANNRKYMTSFTKGRQKLSGVGGQHVWLPRCKSTVRSSAGHGSLSCSSIRVDKMSTKLLRK